jgi:glycosyltransferase involved in cell wall biosynthesis
MAKPSPILLMTYSLGIGGSERQMAEVAKALDRSRFEVHAGCFHADGMRAGELRAAGIPILQLPVTSFASYSAVEGAQLMMRYIRERRIQLVHSFDVPLNIFGAPVAWLARKPVVLTSQRAHRHLTPGLFHRLLRVTDKLTNGIVVNCEYMRRHLLEDEKVPARMIHLCYNGIDTEVFRPKSAGERAAVHAGLENASVVIGVLCALRPEKGLETLVAGFAPVARENDGARLLIVGSGPEKDNLQKQAEALGVADRCIFVPATDQAAQWLRAMDIFVLPSLSEAFSNALMEAMACGCSVVASNVGGNPELAGDPRRGVLFKAGDADDLTGVLRALIADPERRKSLAAEGSAFLRNGFSIAASATRMAGIYDMHLEERGNLWDMHQR